MTVVQNRWKRFEEYVLASKSGARRSGLASLHENLAALEKSISQVRYYFSSCSRRPKKVLFLSPSNSMDTGRLEEDSRNREREGKAQSFPKQPGDQPGTLTGMSPHPRPR